MNSISSPKKNEQNKQKTGMKSEVKIKRLKR